MTNTITKEQDTLDGKDSVVFYGRKHLGMELFK